MVRILMVSGHNCIRMIKESTVLLERGYTVSLASKSGMPNASFHQSYQYRSRAQLMRLVKQIQTDIDIIHVHNEPSWMSYALREALPNMPIIFDYHDSNYWRMPPEDTGKGVKFYEEDMAVTAADAVVFPSQSCAEERQDMVGDRLTAVVPSAVPRQYFIHAGWNYKAGIVSEGGHSLPNDGPRNSWRDYTQIYQALRATGKRVVAFSSAFKQDTNHPHTKYYMQQLDVDVGAHPYDELLIAMGDYEWSLVGNTNGAEVWQYALPNKFFDSVAAGIPVAVFDCPEVAAIVEEHQCGLVVDSVEELIQQWDEHAACRYRLMFAREALTMEELITPLEDLYEDMT